MALRASMVATVTILAASSCALSAETPGVAEPCMLEEEESCMLQFRARAPEHVQCTYSSTMCAGNQCCPRASETGDLTYPCPTADADFTGCENNTHPIFGISLAPDWVGRLVQLHSSVQEPEHVQCTYSSTMCAGNQCCPRASETGDLTYPCPTADANFTGCENNTHPIYGTSLVQEPEHVHCTYSSTMCAGNQCCPRASETGDLTYPCPTADAGFTGCENNTYTA